MQSISVVQAGGGHVGVLDEESGAALTVRLEDGRHAQVTREQLEPLADGTVLLKTPIERLTLLRADEPVPVVSAATVPVAGAAQTRHTIRQANEVVTIPRVEEQLEVEKVEREQGSVRVHVRTSEREQKIAVPVLDVHAEVRRVDIGRIVEEAPPVREEGETVIIPVVEEVLVIQKRLLLREEIHVSRRQSTRMEEHEVSLRSEVVEISRHDKS
jgi:stress response protein YsnF